MDMMKNKKYMLLFVGSIALLGESCSESDKVSDGIIEDQNAVTETLLSEWYLFGSGEQNATVSRIDGGSLSILNNGTGARGECSGDSMTMTMTIQISESMEINTLNISGFNESCDSIYAAFEADCNSKELGEIYSISKGCAEGSFDAACRIRSVEIGFANALIDSFGVEVEGLCKKISESSQNASGRFESSDKPDVKPVVSSSSFKSDVELSSSNLDSVQTSFDWVGGEQDVSRDYFNNQMKKLSSDEKLLLAQEVLGFVPDDPGINSLRIEKVSLEDAKKKFPNTIDAMQKDGVPLKEDYNQIYIPLNSNVVILVLNRITTDSMYVTTSYQKRETSSFENSEEACFSEEEGLSGFGLSYLVDTDMDLSKVVEEYSLNFNHTWTCGCEKTNEACKFLKDVYLQ